ncbi:hypothetical protein D9M70_541220 [compost metagenome]
MITAFVLGDVATHQSGNHPVEDRDTARPSLVGDASKLVLCRPGKMSGKSVLIGAQYIDSEMTRRQKVRKAGSIARQAPKYQRRV